MQQEFHDRRIAAVIVAAGRGERAGTQGGPKQYRLIGGRSVLLRSLDALEAAVLLSQIVIVIHPDDGDIARLALGEAVSRVTLVTGATTRQGSVRAGLEALDAGIDTVLIHDAARPFVDAATVRRVVEAAGPTSGAIAAMPVSDTLKRSNDTKLIAGTVARDRLYAAQTPQGFAPAAILDAHRRAAESGRTDFTDDASIAEFAGLSVALVEGSTANTKITYAEDIDMAERHLATGGLPDVRTGNGYDVHAFEPGDAVMLCGVSIAHDHRLSGHSDADVGLHALTDALLATCGAGDIGTHFPPSDPQWKGAASRLFVEHATALVRGRGGRIANADVTLICEAPKIGPHREAMVAAMAGMLGIDPTRISVKATTNEKLGFIGRGEGIAAIATASVVFPGYLP